MSLRLTGTKLPVVACAILILVMASTARAAGNPYPFPITAAFSGFPSCVVPGMNAKFPLVVTNHGSATRTVTVQLTYVTRLTNADHYSVVIANGTDHLLGIRGAEYWRFRIAPGQTITKHLVTLIQWPFDSKRGPATYGVTELLTVADLPGLEIAVSARVAYCSAQ